MAPGDPGVADCGAGRGPLPAASASPHLPNPQPLDGGRDTDPVWVEGQAADGADPLAHEAVVVLDVVDQLSAAVVDGGELVHGAAAHKKARRSARAGGRVHGERGLLSGHPHKGA